VVAHHVAAGGGEHHIIGLLAGYVLGEGVDQGPGERHRSSLVGLGRPVGHLAVELDRGVHHLDPTFDQIDSPDADRCRLAPAHAGVGQHPDEQLIARTRLRELFDPAVAEEHRPAPLGPRQPHSDSSVPGEPAVADRQVQHQREHAVHLPDR
jgi:hypothetical protein